MIAREWPAAMDSPVVAPMCATIPVVLDIQKRHVAVAAVAPLITIALAALYVWAEAVAVRMRAMIPVAQDTHQALAGTVTVMAMVMAVVTAVGRMVGATMYVMVCAISFTPFISCKQRRAFR
jgi:hypothetical protein